MAEWLNQLNVELNRYLPLPFAIFGTIGLTLNIVIFTRRNLFRNSCVQYLLGNTVANYVVTYWVIVTRILSDGYGNDLSLRSDIFCRFRYFLTYYARTLSTWSIVLACVDRWFSSSQANTGYNTVRLARIVMVIASFVCFLSYFHILFLFGIQTRPNSTSVTCYAQTGVYRIISDLQYLIFYALGPPILMLIFGILTLNNLRRNRRLVMPQSQNNSSSLSQSSKKRDAQLLVMLLFQVLIIIIFTLPFAIQKLVETFTIQAPQTPVERAQYSLLTGALRLFSYGSHTLGFFFYTLAARIFRMELYRLINACCYRLTGKVLFVSKSVATRGMTMMRNDIDGATHTMDYTQDRRGGNR